MLGNHKEAKDKLAIALKMSEAVHSDDLYLNLFNIASRIAEEEGHYQEAMEYQKRCLPPSKGYTQPVMKNSGQLLPGN